MRLEYISTYAGNKLLLIWTAEVHDIIAVHAQYAKPDLWNVPVGIAKMPRPDYLLMHTHYVYRTDTFLPKLQSDWRQFWAPAALFGEAARDRLWAAFCIIATGKLPMRPGEKMWVDN